MNNNKKMCNVFKTENGYFEHNEQDGTFSHLDRFQPWFEVFPNIDFSVVIFNDLNEIGYSWDETQEVDRLVELKKLDYGFFFKKFYLTSINK